MQSAFFFFWFFSWGLHTSRAKLFYRRTRPVHPAQWTSGSNRSASRQTYSSPSWRSQSVTRSISQSFSQSVSHSLTHLWRYILYSPNLLIQVTQSVSSSMQSGTDSSAKSIGCFLNQSLATRFDCLVNWHTNQSLTQSVNRSSEPMNQSIESVDQSVSQSVRQSDSQSVRQSVSQAVSQSVRQSVSQSDSQSVRQSVSQTVSQSVSQSDSQSVSQAVSQSVSQSVTHGYHFVPPLPHSTTLSLPLFRLRYLLSLLLFAVLSILHFSEWEIVEVNGWFGPSN